MSISEKASHNKGLKTIKSFKTIRNKKFYFILLFLYLASISSTFASTLPIDHALTVSLKPSQSIGIFHDIVTIPGSTIQRIKSLQLNKQQLLAIGDRAFPVKEDRLEFQHPNVAYFNVSFKDIPKKEF